MIFYKISILCTFWTFLKIFIDEQNICLWKIHMPAKFHADWTKNKEARANWIFNHFFLVYLAFGNIRYNFNLFYYIDNIYIIKLHMYTKLFVIWVKNNIVMVLFPVPVEYLWEKSLTGRGGYLFSRYDRNFFWNASLYASYHPSSAIERILKNSN